MNIEQIKNRREGREDEAWVKTRTGIETCSGEPVCVAPLGFKARIMHVPDLEDFAIEAMELLGRCLSQMECDWDVIDHDRGIGNTSIEDDKTIMAARAFLKKYTKPD